MNLPQFLHEIARALPENRRDSFLEKLKEVSRKKNKELRLDTDSAEELTLKVNEIIEILTDINDGDRCLES